jgi:AcrR family transcriptional regulator
VSLRKVAAALDAGPMRLYGYMSTKDDLLDLMVDAVYGEMRLYGHLSPDRMAAAAQGEPPRPESGVPDWRAALREVAHRTREAALRHEWFADLLGGRPQLGPNALVHLEASLAAVRRAPEFADIDTAVHAVRTLNVYLVGALRNEIAERRAQRTTGMDERQWQHAHAPYLIRALTTGRYPVLTEAMHDAAHLGPEAVFAAGLDTVLDGIAAGLPS